MAALGSGTRHKNGTINPIEYGLWALSATECAWLLIRHPRSTFPAIPEHESIRSSSPETMSDVAVVALDQGI
jgi:hypothetical protein